MLGLCVCGITGVSLFYADRAGFCSSPTKSLELQFTKWQRSEKQVETENVRSTIFEVWVQMSCGRFHIATWSLTDLEQLLVSSQEYDG